MIVDHDHNRRSRDFQNMIVSDRRSWFGKMIVSDRRSRKKVLCLTLPTDVCAYWCTLDSPSSTLFSQINVSLIALSFHPNL